jgi:ABC-type multidrug transport system fused ATPase/permease subunit
MGVPYDMVVRARRVGGQLEIDLLDIVRINTNRILYYVEASGMVMLAMACFVFTALATLGFYYWVEFAQAVFLLLFPLVVVTFINIFHARRLRRHDLDTGHFDVGLVSEPFTRRSGIAKSERVRDEGSEPRDSRRRPRRV